MKRYYSTILSLPYCVYCGDPASCRDHYRPWSAHQLPYCVSSCSHCNSMLGASGQESLGQRAGYVAQRLRDKHRLGLSVDWEERLHGLEGYLRDTLVAAYEEIQHIRARIGWAEVVESCTEAVVLETLHSDKENLENLRDFLGSLRKLS